MTTKIGLTAVGAAVVAVSASAALADGIFDANYSASMTFDGGPAALEQTSMNMAFDGTNFWSASGGSPGGNRLGQFDASGNYVNSFQPGLDLRSVFTDGSSGPVYARAYNSNQIYVQTSPGLFAPDIVLTGGSLGDQAAVTFNTDGTEMIAMSSPGGSVDQWDSTDGTYLGSTTLSGYGSMFGEAAYPQDRGIAEASDYFLTYSNGMLSAWDDAGTRVGTTELLGAGQTFDSHFSISWADDKVWVIDVANGIWRGYGVGLPAPGAIAFLALAGVSTRRRRA